MAFGPIQIYPIDLQESTAVGINLPLNGPATFISNYQTKDATKNNLINFLLTNPGERPLNPLFGGGLRKFIFEQINNNNLEFIQTDIADKINLYFPNVKIEDLTITGNPDQNTVNISLSYSILNTNINDQLQLNFQ
jgi:phage baseplate assembly protein W